MMPRTVTHERTPPLSDLRSFLRAIEPLLQRTGYGRVVMDTRPLYSGDLHHPEVLQALHAKPDLPVLSQVYNAMAFVRLVLHPDLVSNKPYIDEWAGRVASYVAQDVQTFMMIHCL